MWDHSVYLSSSEEVDVVSKKKKETYEELVEVVTGKAWRNVAFHHNLHVGTSGFPRLHTEVLGAWV